MGLRWMRVWGEAGHVLGVWAGHEFGSGVGHGLGFG